MLTIPFCWRCHSDPPTSSYLRHIPLAVDEVECDRCGQHWWRRDGDQGDWETFAPSARRVST